MAAPDIAGNSQLDGSGRLGSTVTAMATVAP